MHGGLGKGGGEGGGKGESIGGDGDGGGGDGTGAPPPHTQHMAEAVKSASSDQMLASTQKLGLGV